MHELRKDILLGRWVAVLSESKAPAEYELPPTNKKEESSCILCPGRENETPHEITSIRKPGTHFNTSGWWVRALPSFKPVFQVEGDLGRRGIGIYDRMNSIGANEILVESPEHNTRPEDMGLEQMIRVITLYRDRIADLEKDSRLRYILIYKNSGKDAGEIFSHPISYLMATPVIPKRHSCAFHEIAYEEIEDMGLILMSILKKLRRIFNVPPFNYFLHTAPNMVPRKNHWHTLGEDFHWHLEIIPRLMRMSGFEWGSGFYILPTSPENAAKYLREVE